MRKWLLGLLLTLIGCSGSSNIREVTGRLTSGTYGLDNPVVVAESSDHRVFVASVSRNGSFRLQLPAGVAYRMTLANSTTHASSYVAVARVSWPLESGANRWAMLSAGGAIDLGRVSRRSQSGSGGALGIMCDSCSGSSDDGDYSSDDSDKGDCHEDDGAKTSSKGGEDDCDCSHKVSSSDGCDKDQDSDQHDHECDKDDDDSGDDDHGDDDHYGDHDGDHHSCDGGTSSLGGGSSGAGSAGDSCQVNADCSSGLTCTNNACGMPGSVK